MHRVLVAPTRRATAWVIIAVAVATWASDAIAR